MANETRTSKVRSSYFWPTGQLRVTWFPPVPATEQMFRDVRKALDEHLNETGRRPAELLLDRWAWQRIEGFLAKELKYVATTDPKEPEFVGDILGIPVRLAWWTALVDPSIRLRV